jgi:cell volume regulation protein A
MAEISHFAAIVLVVTAGFALAVLSTKLTERVPVPVPAILLLASAIAADLWPRLGALPIRTVERVGVVALIVILFNGGLDIGWRRFRASAASIVSLGLLGTFATAGLVALLGRYALGFSWMLSGLVGAAIAPTDPAVMFSVLGRREIRGRSGAILEGEAGVNDPAGIALMVGMIDLATHADASFLVVVRELAIELTVGIAFGLLGARLLIPALRGLRLPSEGLYPVLALVLAGALYAVTSLGHGSGFLAVFIAGILLGDQRLPYKGEIERFSGSLASLAELVVFVALGLTVRIGSISGRMWLDGIVLAAGMALVARPLVVAATLARARLTRAERAFIAWSGLKGAVPILLAAFAVLEGVDQASLVYGVVFVVVLVSVAGQGTLVPWVARRLRIPMRDRPTLPWEVSIRLREEPQPDRELVVRAGSRADGRAIRDLPLGDHAWITLVVRDGAATRPSGSLELRPGDRVHLLADAAEIEGLNRLFSERRQP